VGWFFFLEFCPQVSQLLLSVLVFTTQIGEKSYFRYIARERGQKGMETWRLHRRSRIAVKNNSKKGAS